VLVKSHPLVQVAVAKRAKKDVLTEMAETVKADQAQYEQESNQRAKEHEMSLSIKWLKANQKYELAKLKLENKRKQIELEAGDVLLETMERLEASLIVSNSMLRPNANLL
jgi:hypothetical protein